MLLQPDVMSVRASLTVSYSDPRTEESGKLISRPGRRPGAGLISCEGYYRAGNLDPNRSSFCYCPFETSVA